MDIASGFDKARARAIADLGRRGFLTNRLGLALLVFCVLIYFAVQLVMLPPAALPTIGFMPVIDHSPAFDQILAARGVVELADQRRAQLTFDMIISLTMETLRWLMIGSLVLALILRRWALAVSLVLVFFAVPESAFHTLNGLRPHVAMIGGDRRLDQPGPPVIDVATLPRELASEGEYILAQQAYAQGDPAAASQHLSAIGPDFPASRSMETEHRIRIIRDYAWANGQNARAPALVHSDEFGWTPPYVYPAAMRWMAMGLFVVGIVACVLGGRMLKRERLLAKDAAAKSDGQAVSAVAAFGRRPIHDDVSQFEQRAARVDRAGSYVALAAYLCIVLGFTIFEAPSISNAAFVNVDVPPSMTEVARLAGFPPPPAFPESMVVVLSSVAGGLVCCVFAFRKRWLALVATGASMLLIFQTWEHLADYRAWAPVPPAAIRRFVERGLAGQNPEITTADHRAGLHYMAAQLAYLDGDADRTLAEINQIPQIGHAPTTSFMRHRLVHMNLWLDANGRQALPTANVGDSLRGVQAQRVLSGVLLVLGFALASLAAAAGGLGSTMRQRIGRLRDLGGAPA